ncbi:MAG: WD40 repeat domain-containing protein [Gemmataceae bacterium]|nr:WD40 repeat domain-containing protein [Gemmataceae bacterium]
MATIVTVSTMACLWHSGRAAEPKPVFLDTRKEVVTTVQFSPDGKTLAVAGSGDAVKLWEVESRKEIGLLPDTTGRVGSVAFSPDGKRLATGGTGIVQVWSVATQAELLNLKPGGGGRCAFSPKGNVLATSGPFTEKTAILWDLESGKQQAVLKGHDTYVTALAFSADGKLLFTGSRDGCIKIWSVEAGKVQQTLREKLLKDSASPVTTLLVSADGKALLASTWDSPVTLWEIGTWKEVAKIDCYKSVESAALSPDKKRIYTARMNSRDVEVWDVATGKKSLTLSGHTSYVRAISLSTDGKTLASGGYDGTARLWTVPSGE